MKFKKQKFKMKSDIILEIICKEKIWNKNDLLRLGYDFNDLTNDEKDEILTQITLNFIEFYGY